MQMKFSDVTRHTDQEIDEHLREIKFFYYEQLLQPKNAVVQKEYFGQKIGTEVEFAVLKAYPKPEDVHKQIENQLYELELSKKFWEMMGKMGEDFCGARNRDFHPEAQERCEAKWVELLHSKLVAKVRGTRKIGFPVFLDLS